MKTICASLVLLLAFPAFADLNGSFTGDFDMTATWSSRAQSCLVGDATLVFSADEEEAMIAVMADCEGESYYEVEFFAVANGVITHEGQPCGNLTESDFVCRDAQVGGGKTWQLQRSGDVMTYNFVDHTGEDDLVERVIRGRFVYDP